MHHRSAATARDPKSQAESEVVGGLDRIAGQVRFGFVPLMHLFAAGETDSYPSDSSNLVQPPQQRLLAFPADAAEFGERSGVGGFERSDLRADFKQEFAGGRVAEDDGIDFFGSAPSERSVR
jgi:hypothetical protein